MKWIPVQTSLLTDGRVTAIAMKTESKSRTRAIGCLTQVWLMCGIADDGLLRGWTFEMLDHELGEPGFCEAARSVEWLEEAPEGVLVPNHDKHMSLEKKAGEAERKRKARAAK